MIKASYVNKVWHGSCKRKLCKELLAHFLQEDF